MLVSNRKSPAPKCYFSEKNHDDLCTYITPYYKEIKVSRDVNIHGRFFFFVECDPNFNEIVLNLDPHPCEIRSSKKEYFAYFNYVSTPFCRGTQIYLRYRLGYLHRRSTFVATKSKSYLGAFFSKQINLPPYFLESNDFSLFRHHN